MDHEGQFRAERELGHRAARLLEGDVFLAAVEGVKDRIWAEFPGATEKRLVELQMELRITNELLNHLREFVDTGKMAAQQLEADNG